MPATSTLRQIEIEVAERLRLGRVIPVSSNTTTTFTLTTTGSPELRGPFTAAQIAVGSPVVCTVETSGTSALGNRTYVSQWVPSTGVLTVSPAIGDTDVTEIIVYRPEMKDPDRVLEAINRALTNRCKRWMKVPLTYVPDGDMMGATVTDYWTAGGGTASYQTLAVPETIGRAVQISHSSATTLQSNTIPVREGEDWYFDTAIRATSDSDSVQLSIIDITNTAILTPSYEDGDGTTSARAFVTQRGTFSVPTGCDRIAFRLTTTGSGTITAQMGPIIAYPKDARAFPLQQRVRSLEHVGNFYRLISGSSNSGPDERRYAKLANGITEYDFTNDGDHFNVHFNTCSGPLYYDELIFGTALTAMTDTTLFPLDQVVKWAAFELYDGLMRDEMAQQKRADNGVPLPSQWRQLRNAALKEAQWSPYEPELVTVVGRR